MHLVVANQVPDRRGRHEDFQRDDAARPVGLAQQRLTDDALEHEAQLRADLRLLVRREDIDDAVDGLRGGVGVQGREREVARLGDAQGRLDGLEVAHLADQDDVRILAQGGAQRQTEALRVAVHFALVHQTALVLVDVLDRILDREDVLVPLGVDLVDHRRQRRRLATAGGAGDQYQAARALRELGEDRRQAQFLEAAHLLGNQTVDRRHGATLIEDVAAEAADPTDAEREVEFLALLEPLLLRVGADAVGQLLGLGGRQRRQLERHQLAVHPHGRRGARRQVQIGAIQLHRRLQQFGQ